MKRVPKRTLKRSNEVPSVASLLRHGQDCFIAGNLEAAESYCRKIQSIDLNDVASTLLLARIKYRQGEMENALGILEKLNDRLPKSPPILNDLAIVYSGTGNHLKALETYQLLISINGANTHTILPCMKAMLALGRAEEALELLTSNQANLKESLELTLAKADCLRRNKQYSAAALLLENESIRQPTNEDILRQLVALYRESDDKLNFERSLRKWLAVNPDNPIAQHLLLSLENVTEEHLESRASDQYVREVFDRFASHFEQSLSELDYRAPAVIQEILQHILNKESLPLDRVLDGGCGTGLCGTFLRSFGRILHGVDLSAGMLSVARAKSLYDDLIEAELTTFLSRCDSSHDNSGYDLIVICDTVNYFGELTHLLRNACKALKAGGWLVFTIETLTDTSNPTGYKLNPTGRYSHDPLHVATQLRHAGFHHSQSQATALRRQAGQEVLGHVFWAMVPK
jgi:predicted TPR repeat methyltransferase